MPLKISEEIKDALQSSSPIVGLESNVISHGLTPPQNFELALQCDEVIRNAGAIPAVTYVDKGRACVGASHSDLERLASTNNTTKVTSRDLSFSLNSNALGATSVSASLQICEASGIKVFASAGLGGVHRDYTQTMDMSGDLFELSRKRVIVVSAGVKKFLDISRTCEVLESLNVPIMGYKAATFPAFYCRNSEVSLSDTSNSWSEIAKIAKAHIDWNLGGGYLVVVPPSPEIALDHLDIEEVVTKAIRTAKIEGISGKSITKHIMHSIDLVTMGASSKANYSVQLEIVAHGAALAKEVSKKI